MSKTEKTFAVLKKKCEQIGHGEWLIRLIIYDGEIVGFDQEREPFIKFRIKKSLDKEDLIV